MQAKGGPDRKKATYLAAGAELRSHFLQVGVAESVDVVCVGNFFLGDMLAHGPKTLPDIAPDARIDHGDAPVLFGIAEDLHFLSKAGNDAVGVRLRLVVQEEVLDHVGLVAKAQHEILVAELAVVVHEMPQDRLVPPRDYRVW